MTDDIPEGGLDWLLDDLVRRLPQADRAIVLSTDGLLISRSSNISRDDADQLSAVASGVQSLSRLLTGDEADMGLVAYEMNLLVRRVGTYLSSRPRGDSRMTEAGRGS